MFFLIQFSINFPAKIRSVKGHSSKADHSGGGGSGKFGHCGRLTEAFHADFDAFDSNSEVCISDLLVHASVNAVFLFRHWVAHEGVDAAVLIIRLGALVGSIAGVNGGAGLGVHVVDGVVEVLVEFLDLLHVLLTVHHVAAHALLLLVAKAIAFDRKVGPGHIALHTHGSVNFSAINFHVCLLAVNFDFVITHLHCSRKLGFIALLSKDCTGECNEND